MKRSSNSLIRRKNKFKLFDH
uniref:Uncharacterized protein n=1 Tax=Rhizophora mucronata TaxID=61149 RepID=A0A2P2P9P9_RHIMU